MRCACWIVLSRCAMTTEVRPREQAVERFADQKLGLGIDARGGFVEDQELWIVRQGAREADELALAD